MSIHTQKSQEVSSVIITSLECCVLNYCGYSSKARGIHFPKKMAQYHHITDFTNCYQKFLLWHTLWKKTIYNSPFWGSWYEEIRLRSQENQLTFWVQMFNHLIKWDMFTTPGANLCYICTLMSVYLLFFAKKWRKLKCYNTNVKKCLTSWSLSLPVQGHPLLWFAHLTGNLSISLLAAISGWI